MRHKTLHWSLSPLWSCDHELGAWQPVCTCNQLPSAPQSCDHHFSLLCWLPQKVSGEAGKKGCKQLRPAEEFPLPSMHGEGDWTCMERNLCAGLEKQSLHLCNSCIICPTQWTSSLPYTSGKGTSRKDCRNRSCPVEVRGTPSNGCRNEA